MSCHSQGIETQTSAWYNHNVLNTESQTFQCSECKQHLPVASFYRYREPRKLNSSDPRMGYYRFCRPCHVKRTSANRRKNPKRYQNYNLVSRLRKVFGLAVEDYWHAHDLQNGLCSICGEPQQFSSRNPAITNLLCVDHDHTTKQLRDLLCSRCNTGLGQFLESPERLRSAADYVERHKISKSPLQVKFEGA